MGGSLQDQLLKSGLVTEDQLREARERPKPSGPRRNKGPRDGGPRSAKSRGKRRSGRGGAGERGAQGDPKRQAQDAKARAKTAEKEAEEAAERALRKRVHQMIADSAQARDDGETAYHFVKGSRIKRIYVTETQRDQLAGGELAVAAMKGKHYLIPMAVAEEIHTLIPAYFVAMGASHSVTGDGTQVDDEYAEYQVPDDLTW